MSCIQGYAKFYDSRNSSFLGATDVYLLYWNMKPSTVVGGLHAVHRSCEPLTKGAGCESHFSLEGAA